MEVVINNVSSLVRSWLHSPLKSPRKPFPHYQPISPRPERLGLGADAAVDNALKGKSVFDVGVQQCVNGRRKPPKRERQVVVVPTVLDEEESSDDDSCSRSAATKRKCLPTSFMMETVHSRKRRRRRKGRGTEVSQSNMNGTNRVMTSSLVEKSATTTPTETSWPQTDVLDNDLFAESATKVLRNESLPTCSGGGGGALQLFIRVDGESDRGDKGVKTSVHREQQLLRSRPLKRKIKARKHEALLRGGSAQCCCGRQRRQLSRRIGPCEPSLLPSGLLSNSHASSSCKTKPASSSVVKQQTLTNRVNDSVMEKGPGGGSPTSLVGRDQPDMSGDVAMNGGDGEVAMESRRHMKKRVTMCRRRRGRLSRQRSSSLQLAQKLYLRKT